MYIELKSHGGGHDDNGPAWIGRVTFSKTGKTVYYRGMRLQRANCACGNHIDIESGDVYWISGPKKNGEDRYKWAGERVEIDANVRQEYWTEIRHEPDRMDEKFTQHDSLSRVKRGRELLPRVL